MRTKGTIRLLILLILLTPGCSLHYDRTQIGFWDQCVKADGIGMTGFTAWGPFNFGRLRWQRNVNCNEDLKPIPVEPVAPEFIPQFIEI